MKDWMSGQGESAATMMAAGSAFICRMGAVIVVGECGNAELVHGAEFGGDHGNGMSIGSGIGAEGMAGSAAAAGLVDNDEGAVVLGAE